MLVRARLSSNFSRRSREKFELKRALTYLEYPEQTFTSKRDKKYPKFTPKINYLSKNSCLPPGQTVKVVKTTTKYHIKKKEKKKHINIINRLGWLVGSGWRSNSKHVVFDVLGCLVC